MKKIIIYLAFILFSVQVWGQSSPAPNIRIANMTTALGQDLPIGSTVFVVSDSTSWISQAAVLSTATMTSALSSFMPDVTKVKGSTQIAVTGSTGHLVLTVPDATVTNAKLSNMATKTYKGRTTAGTGVPEDVAAATLKTDLSLNNVDNISDANKPVSTAQQTALDLKKNISDSTAIAGYTRRDRLASELAKKQNNLTTGTLTESVDGLVLSDSTRTVIGGATILSLKAGRVIPTATNISHAETAYSNRVTSVATGLGLSGGTITSTGTLLVDTATISSRSYNASHFKLISDTTAATGYTRRDRLASELAKEVDKSTTITAIAPLTIDGTILMPVNSAFTSGIGTLADGTYYYRVTSITSSGESSPSTETSLAIAKLATPVNAAFTAGSGTLAAGTYYYRVSAINALGQTLASTETSFTALINTGVNVNWGAVTGATGYKVYGRTTGAELLIATVGAVTTYLDNGSITPAGALPSSNTTGGGINVNWSAVTGATGYKVYGRTTGAELLIATVGAVTTYLDDGSVTPSGVLPTGNTQANLSANRTISIIPATTSVSGSMSAADKAKLDGLTATMVANTPAGNIAATNVQAAINELDTEKVNLDQTTGQTIGATGARLTKLWATDIESTNMPTVGGTSLSTTFAPASVYPATGLTENYVLKKGATTVVNSQIFDNGTNVGIGTTAPTSGKLQVQSATAGTSLFLTDAVNSTLQISHPSSALTTFKNGSDAVWMSELNGNVGIGTTAPITKLQVAGFANMRGLQFNNPTDLTATGLRWDIEADGAESGANAGSNYNVYRYSDTGTYLGNPLTILRANGNIGIGYTDPETYKLKVNGTGFFNGAVTAPSYKLFGATSGTATIVTPSVASTPTLTLPTRTGTLAVVVDSIRNSVVASSPTENVVYDNLALKSNIANPVFTGVVEAPAIKITTGATNGYFLKSDAAGTGTWASVAASQVHKGTWAADTNTPTLADGTGTAGWYYRVTVAGTVDFDGGGARAAVTFSVGDDVSYNGAIWERIPAATITGAALTKVDDTNVTVTLGGSPTTALLNAASITLGWTGILGSARGGTANGFTKFTGPTTAEKTFTLPDASATILTTNTAVSVAQGGTGVATSDANKVFAGPVSGAAAAPAFRTLVSADIPNNAANTSGTAATVTTAAQPTITSVGTLSGLTVTAPIVGSVTGNAGTVTTNANMTGPITGTGNVTSITAQTGTGTTFVMNTSPTLVTPVLGVATATSINGLTPTSTAIGFTIAGGTTSKTLTVPLDASVSGTNTGDNAANSSTHYIGTTSIALNRASAAQALTGITSIDGNAANVTGIVAGANGGTGVANTGKTITLGGNLTTSGAYATTLTATATTSVTLPTSGTLVSSVTTGNGVSATNTAGALAFTLGAITPTTVNGHTFTTGSSTFTGTAGQTYTFPSATSTLSTLGLAESVTGAKTFDKDKILMKGTSTGVTTISTANTSATSYTATLQAASGTIAYTSQITGTNSGTNTGDVLFYEQTFSEFATGATGQINTLTHTPKSGYSVTVSINGSDVPATKYTVSTNTVQVTIPVYQYDQISVKYFN